MSRNLAQPNSVGGNTILIFSDMPLKKHIANPEIKHDK